MNRAYGAYGSLVSFGGARSAYIGQRIEADTDWYLLGERPYSPVLRRFLAPDPRSPLGPGGFNRHAYCGGDPVNRVDPSGHIFSNWSRRSILGTGDAPAHGNVLSTGAASPASAAVAVASVENLSILTSAIAPRTGYSKESAAFGLLADGPGRAPSRALHPIMEPDSLGHIYFGKAEHANIAARTWRPRRGRGPGRIRIVQREAIPPDRLKYSQDGSPPTLTEHWAGYRHHRNPDSTIWAADTRITAHSLRPLLRRLAAVGVAKATVFTSAHGSPNGKNWSPLGGYRLDSEPEFFVEDLRHTKTFARSVGIDVDIVPITLRRLDEMRQELLVSRVNIMACCFGVADRAVMEAINHDVTVYLNPPP